MQPDSIITDDFQPVPWRLDNAQSQGYTKELYHGIS
jgi:hypothetical protein